MKIIKMIVCFSFFIQIPANSQELLDTISQIYNCIDLFQLENEYAKEDKKALAPVIKNFYEYKISRLLRRDEKAMNHIDTLISKHINYLTPWFIREFIAERAFILMDNGYYGRAADYIKSHLACIKNSEDSIRLLKIEKRYDEMRTIPKPTICRKKEDCIIEYTIKTFPKKNRMHYLLPIVINGKTYKFEYDVCCGNTWMTVSETVAKEMGLRIISDDYPDGGTGGTNRKNATLDSMIIGDIVFKNPLLRVAISENSDEECGILGNDFMRIVGAFSIYPREHKIVFPYELKSTHSKHNLMYGNGLYFLQAFTQKERILFTFDSGATTSFVMAPYYQKHKEWFDLNGVKDTTTVRGAGVNEKHDYLTIKSMPITLGKTKINLKNMIVLPNFHLNAFGEQEGTFGTSFFESFRKLTVNFKEMYVTGKK